MARRSGEGRPTVYGDGDEAGTERIFPFDIVPRIVSRDLGPSRSAATFPLFEGLPCSARRAPSKPIAGRTAGWTPIPGSRTRPNERSADSSRSSTILTSSMSSVRACTIFSTRFRTSSTASARRSRALSLRKQDLEQLSRWWDERIRRAIEETPAELLDRAYDEIESAAPAPVSTVS